MKTSVLVSVHGLETSNNFENKVANLINNHFLAYKAEPVKEIFINGAGMAHGGGYGQYKKVVEIRIDNIDFTLKVHSTCAPDFDFFNHNENINRTYSNALKTLILNVIENKLEIIKEQLDEARNKEE